MAVSEDNRGGTDRPVEQRPDGSWHLEDARKRREQRQTAQTTPDPPTTGEPEQDFSALALSLADNAVTTDGTPLSQLDAGEQRDGSDALGLPAGDAPTAEEIMRALETEQHAAAATNNGSRRNAHDPRPVHTPHQPTTWRHPRRRRLHAHRRWVIAGALGAVLATLLAVEVTFGGATTGRERPGHSAASHIAVANAGLIAAATDKFLAVEHAADLSLGRARMRSALATRSPGHRQTSIHPRTRSPSGSASSPTLSSTSGTSEPVDIAQQTNPSSTGPSSGSTYSGGGQPPPETQSHTAPSSSSGSSSSSPSKAALRALVTGAGTCGCQ